MKIALDRIGYDSIVWYLVLGYQMWGDRGERMGGILYKILREIYLNDSHVIVSWLLGCMYACDMHGIFLGDRMSP